MAKKEAKKQKTVKQPKKLQGVVSNIVDEKTIKVRVENKFSHPLYKKIIKKHKSYLVHTDKKAPEVGEQVWIEEGKPISKKKTFYFTGVVKIK